jgi:hypothetical protein
MKNKPQKYIKTKVIEAHVLFSNPNALMRFVMASDSIDTVVLDLQEANPDRNITRASIINWKFLTVEDCKKMGLLTKGRFLKLNNEQNVQASVATDVDSNSKDDPIKNNNY